VVRSCCPSRRITKFFSLAKTLEACTEKKHSSLQLGLMDTQPAVTIVFEPGAIVSEPAATVSHPSRPLVLLPLPPGQEASSTKLHTLVSVFSLNHRAHAPICLAPSDCLAPSIPSLFNPHLP
jgi:hypothetical protein